MRETGIIRVIVFTESNAQYVFDLATKTYARYTEEKSRFSTYVELSEFEIGHPIVLLDRDPTTGVETLRQSTPITKIERY